MGRLWIKLVPLIGNGAREVEASPSGYFVFDGVEMGMSALLIVEKNGGCASAGHHRG